MWGFSPSAPQKILIYYATAHSISNLGQFIKHGCQKIIRLSAHAYQNCEPTYYNHYSKSSLQQFTNVLLFPCMKWNSSKISRSWIADKFILSINSFSSYAVGMSLSVTQYQYLQSSKDHKLQSTLHKSNPLGLNSFILEKRTCLDLRLGRLFDLCQFDLGRVDCSICLFCYYILILKIFILVHELVKPFRFLLIFILLIFILLIFILVHQLVKPFRFLLMHHISLLHICCSCYITCFAKCSYCVFYLHERIFGS